MNAAIIELVQRITALEREVADLKRRESVTSLRHLRDIQFGSILRAGDTLIYDGEDWINVPFSGADLYEI